MGAWYFLLLFQKLITLKRLLGRGVLSIKAHFNKKLASWLHLEAASSTKNKINIKIMSGIWMLLQTHTLSFFAVSSYIGKYL